MDRKLDEVAAAAIRRPERRKLGEDAVAELIARSRERERRMRVQALEAAAAGRPSDPDGQLGPQAQLLLRRVFQARGEVAVHPRAFAPALDSACRLEPRNRRNEMRAREPERRRERIAVLVVRRLLGDGRQTEGATRDYAAKGARPAAELAFDDRPVIHRSRR